ncbi:MAG: hypothetical protein DMD89_36105 [Candidatus Rokuibacteriota bacterium]|nr:MAG: hypothetical protein DMD89_36105 [Candidatus Rokubacteria bacterium]
MSQLRSLRRVTLLVLLLVVAAGPGWAEYCKSQGSPRIPKSQIGPYDAAALLSTTQIIDSEAKHLPWGRPACSRILFHIEYVLCYDVDRKVALWASYRLEAADVVDANRVNAFRTDPRLPTDQNASCDDYAGSGFDRGHMVPRSDMNRSLVAMVNTFFLTNMSPPPGEAQPSGPGRRRRAQAEDVDVGPSHRRRGHRRRGDVGNVDVGPSHRGRGRPAARRHLARRGCGPARAIVTPDAPPAIAARGSACP